MRRERTTTRDLLVTNRAVAAKDVVLAASAARARAAKVAPARDPVEKVRAAKGGREKADQAKDRVAKDHVAKDSDRRGDWADREVAAGNLVRQAADRVGQVAALVDSEDRREWGQAQGAAAFQAAPVLWDFVVTIRRWTSLRRKTINSIARRSTWSLAIA